MTEADMRRALAPAVRRGSVSTSALIALPVLLLVLAGVVSLTMMRSSKTDLQTAADAAALAAGRDLADGLPAAADGRSLARRARGAADEYAAANPVDGEPVRLADDGVTFGALDKPVGGTFEPLDLSDPGSLGRVNAVRVKADRGVRRLGRDDDLGVRATAMLDFAVTGLRPVFDKPLPAVPVALYSSPDGKGEYAGRSWEAQPRRDDWRFDAATGQWSAGPDGVPELVVLIGAEKGATDVVAGVPLRVGTTSTAGLAAQVRGGVTRSALAGAPFAGGLVLGPDRRLWVPAAVEFPADDDAEAEPFGRLAAAFKALEGDPAPRAWPVFGELSDDGRVALTGFAGVRVVGVVVDAGRGTVRVTVQPAALPTAAAETDPVRPPPAASSWGRTVCRLRLAE